MKRRPNVVLILNDDMGYSDLGCYGGEMDTPNLDRLAAGGLRLTQFYNTARCSPSRASLLTGLHPHQTGIGILTNDDGPDGYPGNLNGQCLTMAEVLKHNGYRTYMSGKWHLAHDVHNERHTWPRQRGFDRFYGTLAGASNFYQPLTLTRDNDNIDAEPLPESFYYTDAISDQAVRFIEEHCAEEADTPFFQYVAYTAPHWPLHAKEHDVAKYKGRFAAGWDRLREQRLERMRQKGLLKESFALSERDPSQPPWEQAEHKDYLQRCMEVYAAQIDCMDQGIGRIVQALEQTGQLEHTIIIFLADNGGCAEEVRPALRETAEEKCIGTRLTRSGEPVQYGNDPSVMPGGEETYQSYGVAWANMSNTPFRLYKHWIHEGGISTPFIIHWPEGIQDQGGLRHTPCQLTDVLPTLLEFTGALYPAAYEGRTPLPLEGCSMAPILAGSEDAIAAEAGAASASDGTAAAAEVSGSRAAAGLRGPLYWEHEGNAGVRLGRWKLVRKFPGDWELYDMAADRTELHNASAKHPVLVAQMSAMYEQWAERCGVIPRERIVAAKRKARQSAEQAGD